MSRCEVMKRYVIAFLLALVVADAVLPALHEGSYIWSATPVFAAREDENIQGGLEKIRDWLVDKIGPVVGMIALIVAGFALFAMGARGLSIFFWVIVGVVILTGAESIVKLVQEWFRR